MTEPQARDKKLFCFGFGYTAGYLYERLRPHGWQAMGTTTGVEKKKMLCDAGIKTFLFDHNHTISDPYAAFADVTHLLISVPPGPDGDLVFEAHGLDIAAMKNLEWIGYLSTTGVYGNQDGNWVDENTPTAPASRRGSLREKAEEQWRGLYYSANIPLHIFRLAGIYGPGRSAIDAVRAGTARRIEKEGHVFNRIHVEDIVSTLVASMNKPNPGSIYNLADDHPSSSCDVITFACTLLSIDPPPLVSFECTEMAPIVRSFYKDNKRVRNDKIKQELGVSLQYPDFQSGLQACLENEKNLPDLLAQMEGEAVPA